MRLAFPCIVLFLLQACTGGKIKPKPANPFKDSLTREIGIIRNKGYFNGFSVAIVSDSGTLYSSGFGYADVKNNKPYSASTIQNIASISKTFIGIALLKAQEMGKLNLDDPINKYLPFKVYNPHFPGTEISIRNLANHTSGIADNKFYETKDYYLMPGQDTSSLLKQFGDNQVFNPYDSIVDLKEFFTRTLIPGGRWNNAKTFINKKPGQQYEYSNTGATLAAYIVELATGEPFDRFTKKHILDPLQMTASGWNYKQVNMASYSRLYADTATMLPYYLMITYPDGNFITSANDLAKYLSELIKGYKGKGTILSAKSYAELYRPQLEAKHFTDRPSQNPYDESYNVGVFLGFGFTGHIGHTGGDPGVSSMMFFDPKTGIGRIMIINTDFDGKAASDAFFGIWKLLEKYQGKL